tara:strand:+ start:1205 stop:2299 length:1095 start_codon:yes stop_codon:yes gene_type:complete
MEESLISDIRTDFKNITFSKFQKSKAKQELVSSLYSCKLENACYWCAEFICSGHLLDLWEIILTYTYKYIHYGNPKLTIYIEMRYNNFVTILENGYQNNIIKLRNNSKIRKLFCEIICVLCFSQKKHLYTEVKLNKTEDFNLLNLSDKFKAPSVKYINEILKEDDPKELIVPVNELIYSLENYNIIDTWFWFEWINEYENINRKNKKKYHCDLRSYAPDKFTHDIIWIIWDILFYYSNPESPLNNLKTKSPLIKKIIDKLFKLYTIKFNDAHKKRRKFIIYFAFNLLIENVDLNINIIDPSKLEKIDAIVKKIDYIYKDIKKNEITPKTDYLFKNLKKSNLDKTIEKIEMINNLDMPQEDDNDI